VRENIYDSGQTQEPATPEPPPRKPRPTRNWNTPGWRWARRIGFVVVVILGLAPYVVSRIFDHVVMTTPAPEDLTVFWIGNRTSTLALCRTITVMVIGLIAFWLVTRRVRFWIRYGVTASTAVLVLPPMLLLDQGQENVTAVTLLARIDVADGQATVRHYCVQCCPFICKNGLPMKPVIVVDDRRSGSVGRTVDSLDWRIGDHKLGLCGRLQASRSPEIEVRLTARPQLCPGYTKEEDERDAASGLVRHNTDEARYMERGSNADFCLPPWPVVRPIWPAPAATR
jgi:hypothetical protein